MPNVKTCLVAVTVALAVAAGATPGFAKERHTASHSAKKRLYLSTETTDPREKALRECNAEVEPWNNRDYQGTQIIRYNGCMQQRGQMP